MPNQKPHYYTQSKTRHSLQAASNSFHWVSQPTQQYMHSTRPCSMYNSLRHRPSNLPYSHQPNRHSHISPTTTSSIDRAATNGRPYQLARAALVRAARLNNPCLASNSADVRPLKRPLQQLACQYQPLSIYQPLYNNSSNKPRLPPRLNSILK